MYRFDDIQEANEKRLENGVYLVLVDLKLIPPHIAMVVDGAFYSLGAKGKIMGEPVKAFLKAMNRQKKACLFIELDAPFGAQQHIAKESFENFDQINLGKTTCLSPVKLYLSSLFQTNRYIESGFFPDVMRCLDEQKRFKEVYAVHYEKDYYFLPNYSMEEVLFNVNATKK